MKNNEGNILKFCSFYVSDCHMVTMLVPYVNRKVDEGAKVFPILENDMTHNVKKLVSRMNLEDENKLLNINWTNKNENINDIIDNNKGKELLIIVNGKIKYINKENEKINNYIKENKEQLIHTNTRLKIINCYEIMEFKGNISEILDSHDKILNTSGEKEINEIFKDYEKEEKIG